MKIVGIDPGKSGAAAVQYGWLGTREVYCTPFPSTNKDIVEMFTEIFKLGENDVAYIEEVSGYIGKEHPGSRLFNFGLNYGLLLGVLECSKCRVVKVRRRVWQKGLDLGTKGVRCRFAWKRHLKEQAIEMWPDQKVTLANADALLILSYAINQETKQENSSETEAVPQVEESA